MSAAHFFGPNSVSLMTRADALSLVAASLIIRVASDLEIRSVLHHQKLRLFESVTNVMFTWFRNVWFAVSTLVKGMWVTILTMFRTYRRRTFTEVFEYPEGPAPVKARYRGFHRFDLTTCIACEKCAVACPVDCIYISKEKSPVGKGFRVQGFAIDYTKCMFCALCVEPCPVDCIFMGSNFDLSCFSRDGCIVDYAKLPLQTAWGQATLNPAAVAESKVLYEPVWVKGEPSPFGFEASEH